MRKQDVLYFHVETDNPGSVPAGGEQHIRQRGKENEIASSARTGWWGRSQCVGHGMRVSRETDRCVVCLLSWITRCTCRNFRGTCRRKVSFCPRGSDTFHFTANILCDHVTAGVPGHNLQGPTDSKSSASPPSHRTNCPSGSRYSASANLLSCLFHPDDVVLPGRVSFAHTFGDSPWYFLVLILWKMLMKVRSIYFSMGSHYEHLFSLQISQHFTRSLRPFSPHLKTFSPIPIKLVCLALVRCT